MGTRWPDELVLCGSMFGLKVRRHRWFWSSELILTPECAHATQGRPVGVYHVMGDEIPNGGRTAKTLQEGLDAMGVDRKVPWGSLKEGIPPAYTRWIGEQFLAQRKVVA